MLYLQPSMAKLAGAMSLQRLVVFGFLVFCTLQDSMRRMFPTALESLESVFDAQALITSRLSLRTL